MSWLTATWLVIASACMTLAAIHVYVWAHERHKLANLAFALFALSVCWIGYLELGELHAQTPADFGHYLWWVHFPVVIGMAALVWFVRIYLRAGRAWLGWSAVGLRGAMLVVNLFSSPNVNFSEIVALEKVVVLGDPLSIVKGIPSPWLPLVQLPLGLLLAFVADAGWTVWKRGEQRRAVIMGGGIFLYLLGASTVAIISYWGLARIPVFGILIFVPVVIAMGFELSVDLVRAAKLSVELDEKTVALRVSEQRLAFAADAANAGLWSVEPKTGKLWATPRALELFGLHQGHAHRIQDVLRAVHPEDQAAMREFTLNPARRERSEAVEYRVVDREGNVRWHSARGGVNRVRDGEPELMGATVDVTERKSAEDETERQRAELEHLARVASLSELSGALAHELNQPLAIIMSNAEAAQRLLRRERPDLAEIGAILSDIVEADARAGEVIRRLRSMLKRGTPGRERIAPNRLVEDVLKFMRADLIRRGVAVEASLAPDLPEIRGDEIPLEQVLINIITNACDAMADNPAGQRIVQVGTRADGNGVTLSVADRGCGLPEAADKVFEPFYTTKREGLGMGLPISRSIVAAHGGKLWAESNPMGGATFHVVLPAASESA